MSTLKVKARVTTLGVNAGEHVEIEDTPAVRRKLREGWFVLLRPQESYPELESLRAPLSGL